jgi:RNA polymerase sigma-70 factor (sigma-E family)
VTRNLIPFSVGPPTPPDGTVVWDDQDELTRLYTEHYRSLLRVATLCVHDRALAQDVVHDAWLGVFRSRHRVRDADALPAYLRTAVINQARSRLRRRRVAERHAPRLVGRDAGHDPAAAVVDQAPLAQALAKLPLRQREAVVLRYYADLSEKDTARTMGVSIGTVKASCSRGLATLARLLEETKR